MDHNQLSRVLVRLASTPDADACHVIPKLLPPLLCQLDPEPAATRDKVRRGTNALFPWKQPTRTGYGMHDCS